MRVNLRYSGGAAVVVKRSGALEVIRMAAE